MEKWSRQSLSVGWAPSIIYKPAREVEALESCTTKTNMASELRSTYRFYDLSYLYNPVREHSEVMKKGK